MLGNPQLKLESRRAAETRFKEWWHLIGSAVEHAAGHVSETISFKQMFARTEAKDEEMIERADIIQTLYAINGGDKFTSIGLHEHLAESARKAEIGNAEAPGTAELRRICTSKTARNTSPKSIAHALQAIVDAPAEILTAAASLRTDVNTHTKQRRFWVELAELAGLAEFDPAQT